MHSAVIQVCTSLENLILNTRSFLSAQFLYVTETKPYSKIWNGLTLDTLIASLFSLSLCVFLLFFSLLLCPSFQPVNFYFIVFVLFIYAHLEACIFLVLIDLLFRNDLGVAEVHYNF